MTATDAETAYLSLRQLLTELRYSWLVERVEEHIRQGRIEEREVAVPSDDRDDTPLSGPESIGRRRPGPRTRYLGLGEFSPQERLLFLITAVLHGVVYSQQMEAEAYGRLRFAVVNPDNRFEVRLARDLGGAGSTEMILRAEVPKLIGDLQTVLEALRREAMA